MKYYTQTQKTKCYEPFVSLGRMVAPVVDNADIIQRVYRENDGDYTAYLLINNSVREVSWMN